jgi:hypothetical protein
MRTVPFSQLFSFDEPSQRITPRVRVRIDGSTFGPGVSLGRGLSMGGIALLAMVGKDLGISEERGVLEIVSLPLMGRAMPIRDGDKGERKPRSKKRDPATKK